MRSICTIIALVLQDEVAKRLAVFLGPHTARNAVRTFAPRATGRTAEQMLRSDVPALLEALRPMLRTLIGDESARLLIAQILREVGP
jgi:hypothetical protein